MTGAARLYMDASLRPHRSLSRQGFWILMAVLATYNLMALGFLLAIGATPVPIFLGLDIAGLILAFRIHERRTGWTERVQVDADRVQVSRARPPAHARTVWTSPTAFTRVAVLAPGRHETRVRLTLSGRSLDVAASLSPAERSSFAADLERAIAEARAERHRP